MPVPPPAYKPTINDLISAHRVALSMRAALDLVVSENFATRDDVVDEAETVSRNIDIIFTSFLRAPCKNDADIHRKIDYLLEGVEPDGTFVSARLKHVFDEDGFDGNVIELLQSFIAYPTAPWDQKPSDASD